MLLQRGVDDVIVIAQVDPIDKDDCKDDGGRPSCL